MYNFLSIDFETAGPQRDSACAIGLARVEGAAIVRRAARLIRPPRGMSPQCQAVHGLSWNDVKGAPPFAEVIVELLDFFTGVEFLVAHNAPFDRGVFTACCEAAHFEVPAHPWVCTLALARKTQPKPCDLASVCARLGVPLTAHHEAGADAEACARVLIALEGRQTGTVRSRVIADLFARAGARDRRVYGFSTDSPTCRRLKGPADVPLEYDRLCVAGDPAWTEATRFECEPDEV